MDETPRETQSSTILRQNLNVATILPKANVLIGLPQPGVIDFKALNLVPNYVSFLAGVFSCHIR